MAAGTVSYTDTRGNKDYLSIIAKSIGNRIKQASDMAAEERAYAEVQAEKNNTSLAEAGIGRGHFFKRALGSRFGGDKIARTRGRLGAQGPGTDPSKNYKQRFRGGFDYNYSEQINQVTKDVGGAIVPMSSALSVGLRGVESGLSQVSQSIATIGVAMGQLAVAQQDLARQAMMNGAFMRAFMTYMQRQQSRAGARGEERSIEAGRRRLGGRSGPVGLLPGSGGTGGAGGPKGGALRALDTAQTMAKIGTNAKGGTAVLKAGVTGTKGAARALSKAGISAPNKFLQASAKNSDAILKRGASIVGVGADNKAMIDAAADIAETTAKLPGGTGAVAAGKLLSSDTGYDALLKAIAGSETGSMRVVSSNADAGTKLLTNMSSTTKIPIDEKNAIDLYAGLTGLDPSKHPFAKTNFDLSNADNFLTSDEAVEFLVSEGATKKFDDMAKLPFDKAAKTTMAHKMLKAPSIPKAAAKGGAKGFGKVLLKKLPIIAGLAGIAFGIQRALEGDFLGAGLEITSGLLGATGVGSGLSLGIDGFLLARDMGMMPMAKGGIVTGPTAALIGEGKAKSGRYQAERVQPLNEDTFEMEAEAMLKVQMKEKAKLARIYAEGNKEYFDRQGGWENFGKILGDIFKGLNPMNWRLPNFPNPFAGNGNGSGGGDRPGATAGSDTLDIGSGGGQLQGLSDEDYIQIAKTIAGEAGPGDDQYLVAGAILNRVASSKFPNTVTDVVTAGQGTAHPQFEGYLANANVDDIVKRLKSPEGQARIIASLQRLEGRTDFKGQTQLQNRVAGEDPMFDKKGNFAHYWWQTGPNSVMPSDYVAPNYQQFIKTGNTARPITPPAGQTDYMKKWMESIGQGEKQSMQLNQSSLPLSMAPFTVMPNITNVYNQQMASGAGGEDSVGSPFNTLGLDAFALPYSLFAKT